MPRSRDERRRAALDETAQDYRRQAEQAGHEITHEQARDRVRRVATRKWNRDDERGDR